MVSGATSTRMNMGRIKLIRVALATNSVELEPGIG
jgi:hypothetical protein